MISRRLTGILFTAVLGACAAGGQGGTASSGSTHSMRLKLPPEAAARCFARNAEEHSSALAAEVTRTRTGAAVAVRVKNGTPYAHAAFERSGAGSAATLVLRAHTTGRRSDLVDALMEGC